MRGTAATARVHRARVCFYAVGSATTW